MRPIIMVVRSWTSYWRTGQPGCRATGSRNGLIFSSVRAWEDAAFIKAKNSWVFWWPKWYLYCFVRWMFEIKADCPVWSLKSITVSAALVKQLIYSQKDSSGPYTTLCKISVNLWIGSQLENCAVNFSGNCEKILIEPYGRLTYQVWAWFPRVIQNNLHLSATWVGFSDMCTT